MNIKLLVLHLCVILHACYSLEYVAVVEHSPKKNDNPLFTIQENLNEYRRYLEAIKVLNVDVIVFPEYGLTGLTEDVEKFAIETKDSEIITELSSMSAEYQINMVVNLLERLGYNIYWNTNLVFNKTGAIVAKYRKININPVKEKKLTAGNEVVEFMLEGKKFATITNDDILFDYPSNNFSVDVSHVAIPMSWRNLRPFNTATSMQAGYAIKNNKVVLAANLNDIGNNISGSGIYCREESESFITGENASEIITNHKVLRRTRQNSDTSLNKLPLDMINFISETNKNEWFNLTWIGKLNQDNLSCSIFFPRYNKDEVPLLSWGVLSGSKDVHINERKFSMRMCAYIACATQSEADFQLDKCGHRYKNDNVTFEKVQMRTNLDFSKSMPITLDYDLKPIDDVTWKEVDGNIEMGVNNIKQRLNLAAIVELTPVNEKDFKVTNARNGSQITNSIICFCSIIWIILFILKLMNDLPDSFTPFIIDFATIIFQHILRVVFQN